MRDEDEIKTENDLEDRILGIENERIEVETTKVVKWALFIGVILVSAIQIYGYLTDRAVRRYVCPANLPVLDAPVKLTRIEKVQTKKEFQNLILGFVRKFVRAQHPHNPGEVEKLYGYVAEKSSGWVREDYLARLKNIDKIKVALEQRNYTALYPKSHFDIKVRRNPSDDNVWIVQFPAVEVRRKGNREFGRTYVNATYTIYFNTPDLDSTESGPTVTDYKLIEIVDNVTEEERNIRK